MRLRHFISLLLVVFVLIASVKPAQAHVLFVDRNTNIAAIFHSNPNDDPIAGERSELYFDVQDKNTNVRIPYSGYDLYVTDESGQETILITRASGSTVSTNYIFPAQGLYLLSLRSQSKYDTFQKVAINGSIRIERGLGIAAPRKDSELPTIGIIAGLTATSLLAILFINNRKKIIAYSTF